MDTMLFQWLNSWAGANEELDVLIIFSAIFLWYWMMAGVLAFPVASLFPKYRHTLRKHTEIFLTAFASAFAARLVITELIRFLYNRPRPFEILVEVTQLADKGFIQLVDHTAGGAFPSGHASLAFAVATAVSFYYPKTSIIFWAAAILIGLGRVAAGVHRPSDILGGAVVGIVSAWALQKSYKKWKQKRTGIRS